MFNYDSSSVGVPYVRVSNMHISYTTDSLCCVNASQELSVKLADGSIAIIEQLTPISFTIDLKTQGSEAFGLVHPTTGTPLGQSVTNNQIMLSILAALRAKQIEQNV
jgi:hypothetical protein